MEKNRKQIIICAAIVACVCVISVLITYNILQQKNHLTVELYYGTFDCKRCIIARFAAPNFS